MSQIPNIDGHFKSVAFSESIHSELLCKKYYIYVQALKLIDVGKNKTMRKIIETYINCFKHMIDNIQSLIKTCRKNGEDDTESLDLLVYEVNLVMSCSNFEQYLTKTLVREKDKVISEIMSRDSDFMKNADYENILVYLNNKLSEESYQETLVRDTVNSIIDVCAVIDYDANKNNNLPENLVVFADNIRCEILNKNPSIESLFLTYYGSIVYKFIKKYNSRIYVSILELLIILVNNRNNIIRNIYSRDNFTYEKLLGLRFEVIIIWLCLVEHILEKFNVDDIPFSWPKNIKYNLGNGDDSIIDNNVRKVFNDKNLVININQFKDILHKTFDFNKIYEHAIAKDNDDEQDTTKNGLIDRACKIAILAFKTLNLAEYTANLV